MASSGSAETGGLESSATLDQVPPSPGDPGASSYGWCTAEAVMFALIRGLVTLAS
jgi:hypothetical protein